MPDPRFAGTVIYMIRNGPDGAGFVINRVLAEAGPGNILDPDFRPAPSAPAARLLSITADRSVRRRLHPARRRLFDRKFGQGRTRQRLALGRPGGPARDGARRGAGARLFILGYSGWARASSKSELARDDWVIAPGDTELLFDPDLAGKWRRAWDNRGMEL